jgi:hypothetical protein
MPHQRASAGAPDDRLAGRGLPYGTANIHDVPNSCLFPTLVEKTWWGKFPTPSAP